MNSPIRKVSAGCLLLALALLANVTWVQAFQADSLNARDDNRRVLIDQYSRNRGSIIVGDEAIVSSVPSDGQFAYQRQYAQAELYAHLTGYYSFVFGRSGIEDSQNDYLAGTADDLFVRRLADLITGSQTQGGSVKLTIDPAAQQAAWDALGDFKGAVVAIEPSTGRILASVSKPSFDPSPLASHDLSEQQAAWDEFVSHDQAGSDFAVRNRALTETLPPGSVFKLVTAAAALESGQYEPESVVDGPAVISLPQTDNVPLPNYNGQPCGANDQTTITNALRISCNTAFALIGLDLGADAIRLQARKFGFDTRPLEEVRSGASVFPAELDAPQLAQSSIGQRDVRVTPLQVAMVTAAIANDGLLMQPFLVEEIRDSDLSVMERTEHEDLSEAISRATAQELQAMMVEVVENGTGRAAQMPGILVGGKTGTAQRGAAGSNLAWFTSFAPADNPQVAVAVVIEEAPGVGDDEIAGGRLAAPVARAVMEAVLGS